MSQKTEPLFRLRDVTKVYASGGAPFTALKGITVDFGRGEFVGIVGKSGAGKSTLVNVITGVDHLTSGEIWVGDTALHALDENQMALWRGHNIGVIYQTFELLPQLSLLDNVLLPMDFCGLYKPRESAARAKQLLALVGLKEHMYKPPTRISGGQQQRVAIARALANDPPIIVADEPTGNLDSATAEAIFELFEGLVANGKTIVMVTHDASLATRFSRVLQIVDGELGVGSRE
ncbi:MAG TPA: ABC transporter ATP-binding protein [Anaerolineae bacterium]|nr:ABC transporter ATP-binding protein [Anaerolineae bacterium]HQI86147.1 ABC transporter ATP-binding protein [Anaerolineae bacterium]